MTSRWPDDAYGRWDDDGGVSVTEDDGEIDLWNLKSRRIGIEPMDPDLWNKPEAEDVQISLSNQEQMLICRAIRNAKLHIDAICLRETNNRMIAKERAGQFVTSLKRELHSLIPDDNLQKSTITNNLCDPEIWEDSGVLTRHSKSWKVVYFMDGKVVNTLDPLVDYAKNLPPEPLDELKEISIGLDALQLETGKFKMHIKNAIAINVESDKVIQNLAAILEN